jgi:integrase
MQTNKGRTRRGRGEGGIYQRADGQWCASVSLGYDGAGKRKRKVIYGATKKAVQDELGKLQHAIGAGTLSDAGAMTVREFLDRWLANTAKPSVTPTTYARYAQQVRLHLNEHLGHVRLAKLTALHVEQLYAGMAEVGDSASERRKVGKVLRHALNHAIEANLIPNNPAAKVRLPVAPKEEVRPLDLDQATRFLKAARPERLYAMYVLDLDSGMRQGELFAVHWSDLDFDIGSVQVHRSLEEIDGKFRLKDVKTKKGRRRIDLSRATLDALNDHRRRMLAEGRDVKRGLVFCDHNGNFLRKSNVRRRSFDKILGRANKEATEEAAKAGTPPDLLPPIRFHDLRHTCATLLLLADENVKVISERLGHSKIQMTLDTYSHVLPTMQKRAAEKMNLILGRMLPQAASS